MTIHEFIVRCDAFCDRAGVTRTWLSKRLFADTFRLESLASAASDVGVRRLAKAVDTLNALERERWAGEPGSHDGDSLLVDPSVVAPGSGLGAGAELEKVQ